MRIVMKKLSEIKPYSKNPRHNDKAVDAVAESICEFGFKVPVLIDGNGTIVCGHTRYKAAEKLNLNAVPCIIADDLTDEQIRAFRLADNKTAEIAEWDFDLLSEELEDINDINMNNFGFTENEELKLFDFMENDRFIESSEKETFQVTFEFDIKYKPQFDLYMKKSGKSKLLHIIENEVIGNA